MSKSVTGSVNPSAGESSAAESAHEELLASLADEFAARLRRGEPATVEEYAAKHPALAERIKKVLPVVAMMEQTQALDVPQAAERIGTTIGRYKLLERIGEGGFGVVYMAEQQQPVRRKVALKVIKPGMDSRQVLARFEAERQALAMMEHPNIARVLDAGATDSGRPYFVMELIKGVPITEFCDQGQLTPRQRLELFLQVCGAVQHAHQKGVIHRDIKPSNVLVMLHDTIPAVKVIDFGVAKALGQTLTENTLFTGFAQLVGTPLYMSPEQAGQSSLDVDTRSDVYSLGVLLYELLTGVTPFDKERFKQAAHDEIRRIIREEEPPKPSTRLSESKDTLPSISAQRQTEPAKLTKLVRGDLDWIVMKALEKDRTRRYETATGLAADVHRYLTDDPVEACPPSTAYRFRKFARRNRSTLITVLLVTSTLIGATVVSTWQAMLALKARAQAEELAAREAKLHLREKARRAEALFLGGEEEQAETLLRELPDDFVAAEPFAVAPLLRALAHWHAGEKRWRQSAACYDLLLFGPAKQSAVLYDKNIAAGGSPTGPDALRPFSWSLLYLEYAPLLVELGDRSAYRRLRESAIERYSDSNELPICEVMLHATLLLPEVDAQATPISKWAELAAANDGSCNYSALALFNYRQGNHELVVDMCEKCLRASPAPAVAIRARLLRAMAELRLNRRNDAEEVIVKCHEAVDALLSGNFGVGQYGGNLWADWLMNVILLREADELLRGEQTG